MTPVPDFVAGARALLAATSDCTINGEPAVVVRIAELNDLVARVHRAEAAARPAPPQICELPHETIAEEDECERRRTAARTTPDNPDASSDAADNPAVAAPATADDGLRERVAAAIREHWLVTSRDEADADGNAPCRCGDWREPGPMGSDEDDWDSHLADAVLAIRDRRMEQLAAGRETWKAKALEMEAERDRLAAKVEALEANYGQVAADAMAHGLCNMKLFAQVRRAEQAEDLLRAAHDTSNRSEAERARAVQRAEQAEATIARVRSLTGRWAKRTDQLKRAAELLDDALAGPEADRA